jgi:hypothetical protein
MRWLLAAWVAILVLFSQDASAQNLIERPGAHTRYVVELEPHLMTESRIWGAFGAGGRATFEVLHQGFIPTINNSVGVGVGLDFGYVDGCYVGKRGQCYRNDFDFVLPVVMQWNFWFSPHWSAFAEPGLAIGNRAFGNMVEPVLAIGGRYQILPYFALTLRLGYPITSFGVSFFL